MTPPPILPSVEKRWVAFADVLGFQELSRLHDARSLANIYRGALVKAAEDAAAGGRQEHFLTTINLRLFSDSVLMWTDHDNAAEFVQLLQSVRYLLAASLVFGLPMRAAIEYGELAISSLDLSVQKRAANSLLAQPSPRLTFWLRTRTGRVESSPTTACVHTNNKP